MTEDIKDIAISQRKKFRIDGDEKRILELDTSDMNILPRLNEVYPKIRQLGVEATDKMSELKEDETSLEDISKILTDIDNEMRKYVDYIFDSNVSEVCAPKGNMFDVTNAEFRFEHIIDVLTNLYANNLSHEFKQLQDKVKKRTAKYTNRRKK